MKRTRSKIKQAEGFADGRLRYPQSKHAIYHQTYKLLSKNSFVLNDSHRAMDFENSTMLVGLSECKSTLIELVGNNEGYYIKKEEWYKAKIPVAQQMLRVVKRKFSRWQKRQVLEGFSITKPKTWPPELLDERLKAEALLDVRNAEKTLVEARIKELTKTSVSKVEILPYGPQGRFGKKNDRIVEADGQRVLYSKSGVPFIDEPKSPYHRMAIANYRQMSVKWKQDVGISIDQLRKLRDEIFEAEKRKAAQEGNDPPVVKKSISARRLPEWMKLLGISKQNWPEWPKDAKPVE